METTPQASAIEFSTDIALICEALAKAQGEIRNAERDAENPYFGSSYSSLAAVWDAVRAPLAKNGLAIIQGERTRIKPELTSGEVDVTTMVLHSSGQWFRTTVTLPVIPMSSRKKQADQDNDVDRVGGRITPQAIGSAITYGRRYGLESVTGTAPEAEDDDGNSASGQNGSSAKIPEGGQFEDVVVSVTFREQKKSGGGSFTIAAVKTSKHGDLECYEKMGAQVKNYEGTGQALSMKAEKGKFGWKLLEFKPMESQAEPGAEEKDVLAKLALELQECRTKDDFTKLRAMMETAGGAWLSAAVKAAVNNRFRELFPTERKAA